MATITQLCVTTFNNTGNPVCYEKTELGVPVSLLITTDTFEFSTFSAFLLEAGYTTAIKAGTMLPVPGIQEFEDLSEDEEITDSALGGQSLTRLGNYRGNYYFNKNLCSAQALEGFTNKRARFFIVDSNNNVLGYSPDGTVVKGFSIDLLLARK